MTTYAAHESVTIPTRPGCDICRAERRDPARPAIVDGKTRFGPWAYMCAPHYAMHGVGLGLGRGQALIVADGIDPMETLGALGPGPGLWSSEDLQRALADPR